MATKKLAQVFAASLEIVCPECGGAQPNPDDGSLQWSAEQLSKNQGVRACVECDATLLVSSTSKAQISYHRELGGV